MAIERKISQDKCAGEEWAERPFGDNFDSSLIFSTCGFAVWIGSPISAHAYKYFDMIAWLVEAFSKIAGLSLAIACHDNEW